MWSKIRNLLFGSKPSQAVSADMPDGTSVALEDFQGESYLSVKFTTPFGRRAAYVYRFTSTGFCILLDDGSVFQPHYIKRWKYV